jgi:transcriptional regulator with GAF, ATPase, and Fis domain
MSAAISVWLELNDPVDDDAKVSAAVRAALARAGATATMGAPVATRDPGVLFFRVATPSLLARLHELGGGGRARVLAVALPGSTLPNGTAWRLRKAGASDAFAWDHSCDPTGEIAARLLRWHAVEELVRSPLVRRNLVGDNPEWLSLLREIVQVAAFSASSVLIMGESGTGKELIARLTHTLDRRPDRADLVTLDCTTLVPELSGSEFFGHERGAFTGAHAARDGAFAMADGGTLFLDEVGELPPRLQAQLLRVIQERTYKRVGGNEWLSTRFRLVCATNRDLPAEVERGTFRGDLYHRIASFSCRMPPLRDRPDDVLPLVRHFLAAERDDAPQEIDPPVADYLVKRSYPGNVRDLKQLVSRIAQRHVGPGPITVGDIPGDELPSGDDDGEWHCDDFERSIRRAIALGVTLREIARVANETAIRLALSDEAGNLQRAARRLGVTDRALQMRRARSN